MILLTDSYVEYVVDNFGTSTILCDGYNGEPTIKDLTRLKRTKGLECEDVEFNGNTCLSLKKDVFLRNSTNKNYNPQDVKFIMLRMMLTF